jgi:hypothetical protein
VLFAGVNGQPREAFITDKNNWQPRVGLAYKLKEKWVLRGGYGLYYLGQDEFGPSTGFSRTTPAIVTVDNLTPYPGLTTANPFIAYPGGKLLDPVGNSLGAASFSGRGRVDPVPRARVALLAPVLVRHSARTARRLPGGNRVLRKHHAGFAGELRAELPPVERTRTADGDRGD